MQLKSFLSSISDQLAEKKSIITRISSSDSFLNYRSVARDPHVVMNNYFSLLPVELLLEIIAYLSVTEVLSLSITSKFHNTVCKNSLVWKNLARGYNLPVSDGLDYQQARCAVEGYGILKMAYAKKDDTVKEIFQHLAFERFRDLSAVEDWAYVFQMLKPYCRKLSLENLDKARTGLYLFRIARVNKNKDDYLEKMLMAQDIFEELYADGIKWAACPLAFINLEEFIRSFDLNRGQSYLDEATVILTEMNKEQEFYLQTIGYIKSLMRNFLNSTSSTQVYAEAVQKADQVSIRQMGESDEIYYPRVKRDIREISEIRDTKIKRIKDYKSFIYQHRQDTYVR